ncbi:2-succinyl-5-enolpyruvyl-6-hydroxy-3-cyclohexene-1-carboxylic-acid synthase [Bacillus sp. B15-48]|uniref:2-succinyl-5-enolpyruvyl-6-hydroxy-3- cyclohexene-1-carboxylic-acid synthase n=1 Tax=Bacillus sp. B15-48 TaxID=1548601 RepID=UPI00193F4583|nr:2-succinyl-5-enolpyruvyl-6-hydroxy-3-cyclohexene-1-carboxylic-acid synthase [Bacillus sp. B15-48]MBM4762663.1 2-succinyl-5-enolpyruvyl-6-hydroxy-3-cyclohexene-1-carboxylic-acid synthase [Bacillus sp. B15-48]
MNHQEDLTAYLSAFVAELTYSGVSEVVISPGSRSTPIALVMAEHPKLNLHIQVDERSAGFFGLGIAKASKKPVVLLCTSGTAAANYYPAIIEAKISRIPLIVLTADRPHELRDVGAPQAIDQIHLYSHHVKWFMEMSPPGGTDEMLRYARTVCARAAATAIQFPAGPVHLNFPIREPLIPALNEEMFQLQERNEGFVEVFQGKPSLSSETTERLLSMFSTIEDGVIVCGPIDDHSFTEAIIDLAEKLNYPILADPLSQLRSGNHKKDRVIDAYDTFLRVEEAKNYLTPKLIVRFGAMPVSKALTNFIRENRSATQIVIDGGNGWRDPLTVASQMVYCDETMFCKVLIERLKSRQYSDYLEKWLVVNELSKTHLHSINEIETLSEGKLFSLLAEVLPDSSTIFVGNSMPIRDLDTFFLNNGKEIKVMGNRGANGIDGVVSTALGVATVSQPLYLVLGDLTFFHDLNGLLSAKQNNLNITILLINNNGGGIFSFLPQANDPKHFELLFGTPLNVNFRHVVEMYGGTYVKIEDWEHFHQTFTSNLKQKGLKVMEIMTNRDKNLIEHRDLWNSVSREISVFLGTHENEN